MVALCVARFLLVLRIFAWFFGWLRVWRFYVCVVCVFLRVFFGVLRVRAFLHALRVGCVFGVAVCISTLL